MVAPGTLPMAVVLVSDLRHWSRVSALGPELPDASPSTLCERVTPACHTPNSTVRV